MSAAGSLNVTLVSHSSPPNGTTWISTAPRGRNTMLVSPAPCTPIITSAEFTSRANVAMSVCWSGSAMRTSKPASAAAAAISRSFRNRREPRREMMSRRGLPRPVAPPRDAATRSSPKPARRARLKSTTETWPGDLDGITPMSLWKVAPTTIRGKQWTSSSLSTSTTSKLVSCRKKGVNLATHHGFIPLRRNWTLPLNLWVLMKSGTSTSV
uniref:Uncharacterized protein n=1 Tax=Arundo donax TaxID=35708 RepID=A0A0A9F4J5_ARUDO